MQKTSMRLNANLAGALCYLLGWITGLIFLLSEEKNQFVRFHAVQSIITFGGITVVSIVLGFIPYVDMILGWLLSLLGLALWVILMVKAYQGERYKLPWVGDFAEEQLRNART